MPDFLLEIGCEEIPARMIEEGAAALWEGVRTLLNQLRLSSKVTDPGDYGTVFSSPRRLAVFFPDVLDRQPKSSETVVGPSVKVAFKDGIPTTPALAFANKVGLDISNLSRVQTPKGEYLSANVTKEGRWSKDLLAEMIPSEILGIAWAKNMYWQGTKSDRFVRPVRWLVALLDKDVVPVRAFGVLAQNTTQGHRTLGAPVCVERAGLYQECLKLGKVIGDRSEREHQIRKALDAATRTIPGARWREDKALLDTVVNLTEFPSAILGSFDAQFLALPEEVLVTVMRDHQKYFAVEDANGKLAPHFLAVLNTDSDPQGLIRHGNERVLRARFNDARFFWETDQKKSLLERLESLKNVTFQKDLGSYFDKTQRVQRLCSWLSEILKQGEITVRPGVIHKAACLSKTDLTTELVKEFTELQGIVGGLYARAQQLDPTLPEATRFAIADAIYDHYKPESTDDDVPRSIEGSVLSIGDKADTIAGMFALGLVPSGSKDPFALRRQANAIVKVIAEKKLPLKLSDIVMSAVELYRGSEAEKKFAKPVAWWRDRLRIDLAAKHSWIQAIRDNPASDAHRSPLAFLWDRLQFFMRDVKQFPYDVTNAVLAADPDDVVDALARAEAVRKVQHMPEFQAIGAACKRMRNILRQAAEKGIEPAAEFEYLPESAHEEKSLRAYMERTGERVERHRSKKEYYDALLLLSTAREPVDAFFDKVMVMVEDAKLRANRLALLRTLLKEFSTIADFSEIVAEGKA